MDLSNNDVWEEWTVINECFINKYRDNFSLKIIKI